MVRSELHYFGTYAASLVETQPSSEEFFKAELMLKKHWPDIRTRLETAGLCATYKLVCFNYEYDRWEIILQGKGTYPHVKKPFSASLYEEIVAKYCKDEDLPIVIVARN